MAATWKIVWHGALTSQRAAGMIDVAMKRFHSHAGFLLKVDKNIFWLLYVMIYDNCNFELSNLVDMTNKPFHWL